jgi:uncharacterized membrane protein YfcA
MSVTDHGGMEPHVLLGVLLIGAGVGLVAGAFGKGGSAIATPLLHGIGVPAMAAVASPLPAAIPSTLLASREYARAGEIDRRIVRIGACVGVPLTVLGALLTRWIPGGSLVLAADIVVIYLGLHMLIANDHETTAGDAPSARRVAVVVGTVGFVSGLLANAGGFLLAPLFMRALHMPVRRALGTSILLATVLAVPGTVVHAWLGHIDWTVTAVFAFGAMPLATMGARFALRVRANAFRLVYGFGLTTVAGGLLLFAH